MAAIGEAYVWEVVYTDDSTLRSDAGAYADVDRSMIARVRLWDGSLLVADVIPDTGQDAADLVIRRRHELGTDGHRMVWLLGFPTDATDFIYRLDPLTHGIDVITNDVEPVASEDYNPDPDPEPEPEPILAVNYTSAERSETAPRRLDGPFRVTGDAFTNSPNDWTRIVAEADALIASPNMDLWAGPPEVDGSGVLLQISGNQGNTSGQNPPRNGPGYVRSAAERYLISGHTGSRDAAKAWLLTQLDMTAYPLLDFRQKPRYDVNIDYTGSPLFDIANWGTKLTYALSRFSSVMTASEYSQCATVLYYCADWLCQVVDNRIGGLFSDRAAGTQTGGVWSNTTGPKVGYDGSSNIYNIHKWYWQNRTMCQMRLAAVLACELERTGWTVPGDGVKSIVDMKASAALYVKEWVKYSVWPEGMYGEFERASSTDPEAGWRYAIATIDPAVTIADVLARHGDTSVYDFSTSDGVLGSGGGPKTFKFAVRIPAHYCNGTYNRQYAGATIDAQHGGTDWLRLLLPVTALANHYYRDADMKADVERTGGSRRALPTSSPAVHHGPADGGDWWTRGMSLLPYHDLTAVHPAKA